MSGDLSKVIKDLRIAVQTEIAGHVFYLKAAELTEDAHGKNIFKHLAEEELEHMEVVKAIADSLENDKGWPLYKEALRVGAEAELPVFPSENELTAKLDEDSSDKNALKIAMDSEFEAVSFYLKMLKAATSPAEKLVLTRLLEMEKGHLKLLRWESDALAGEGFWCDMMEFSVEKEIG
jgi:rubrerythrin